MTPYDTIELFGLTENGPEDLPVPNLEEIETLAIRSAMDAVLEQLSGTGLEADAEPIAHALATVFDRRKKVLETQLDKETQKLRALVYARDGSEVTEIEIERSQRQLETLQDRIDAFAVMAEEAGRGYERHVGKRFVPASAGRITRAAKEAGAIYEAKAFLEDQAKAQADARKLPEGPRVIVAGDADWTDVQTVFDTLDKVRERHPDMLIAIKQAKGAEATAASWAGQRGVHTIRYQTQFNTHGRAAPFRANEDMLNLNPIGVLAFGSGGSVKHMAEIAEAKGIRAKVFENTSRERKATVKKTERAYA
ncbi:MAG: SLOG family protein [Pseudomonadota bacterium]